VLEESVPTIGKMVKEGFRRLYFPYNTIVINIVAINIPSVVKATGISGVSRTIEIGGITCVAVDLHYNTVISFPLITFPFAPHQSQGTASKDSHS
jgi:hypothetical protein